MPFAFLSSPHKPFLWKHWKNNPILQMNRNESSPYTSRALSYCPGHMWAQPSPCSCIQCGCIASPWAPVNWQAVMEKPLRFPVPLRCQRDACTAAGKGADTWVQKTPQLEYCVVARIRPSLTQCYFWFCHSVILEKNIFSFLKL